MKTFLDDLHKAFESRVRLGIMSALAVNDTLDFTALKEFLDVTDGTQASNVKAEEKENYIGVKKAFVDRKPNKKYFMTKQGKKAFEEHISALEKLIRSQK